MGRHLLPVRWARGLAGCLAAVSLLTSSVASAATTPNYSAARPAPTPEGQVIQAQARFGQQSYNGRVAQAGGEVLAFKAGAKFDATDTGPAETRTVRRQQYVAGALAAGGAAMTTAGVIGSNKIGKSLAYGAAGVGLIGAAATCVVATFGICAIGILASGLAAASTAVNFPLFDGEDATAKGTDAFEGDSKLSGGTIKTTSSNSTTQINLAGSIGTCSNVTALCISGLTSASAAAVNSTFAVKDGNNFRRILRAEVYADTQFYPGFSLFGVSDYSRVNSQGIGTQCIDPDGGKLQTYSSTGSCSISGGWKRVGVTNGANCYTDEFCTPYTDGRPTGKMVLYYMDPVAYGSAGAVPPRIYQPVVQTGMPIWAIMDNPAAADQLEKKMSDQALAAMMNEILKNLPGSSPYKYDATDPITATDVRSALASNPAARPSYSDLYRPVAPPGQSPTLPAPGTNVITNPSTAPATNPSTSPSTGTGTTVDLGPAGDASLPSTLVDPIEPLRSIKGLLPSFVVVLPDPGCPPIVFNFGGFFPTLNITTHCPVGTAVFPSLTAIMITVYTVAGLMIFLMA